MEFDFNECVRQGVEQAMKECELKINMTLLEAVKRMTPQKPLRVEYPWATCPTCGGSVCMKNVAEHVYTGEKSHCEHCGQCLDWEEA